MSLAIPTMSHEDQDVENEEENEYPSLDDPDDF
jgi:hypothetical protein